MASTASAKVALITGGASGMGLGMTRHLVQLGWNIAIVDFNQETGKKVAEELGNQVLYIRGNVAKYEDQAAAFVETWKKWGRLDFVWANAGIADRIDFVKSVEEDASGAPPKPDVLVVDICLYGCVYSSYLAFHFFRKNESKGGKLVMTSSMAGLYPAASISLYGAAKHGVVGLTRSLAASLKQRQEPITVNCLCPGLVPTNIVAQALLDVYPKDKLTPISTIIKAVEGFLNDDSITGQAAECSGLNVHYVPVKPYPDEEAEYLLAGKYAQDIVIDPLVLAKDGIEKGKKVDALLAQP